MHWKHFNVFLLFDVDLRNDIILTFWLFFSFIFCLSVLSGIAYLCVCTRSWCMKIKRSSPHLSVFSVVRESNESGWVGLLSVKRHQLLVSVISGIDREFVTSAKKNSRILTNFPKLKNSYKNSLNARVGVAFQWNSLLICIISNKPTTTTEEFDAFHGFMSIKI